MVERIWKIVTVYSIERGKRTRPVRASLVAEGKAEVIYSTNKWATAPEWLSSKGYHLTAFCSYDAAKSFYDSWTTATGLNAEIWEAEAIDEVPLPPFCYMDALAFGALEPEPFYTPWPRFTRMYKKIRLTKRVWPAPSQEEG